MTLFMTFIPAQLKVLEIWQEKAVFERDGALLIKSKVGYSLPNPPDGLS